MDNSSLNASHRFARQACKFFRVAKFDDAIGCHEMAKAKLDEAMQSVLAMPRVLESLRLQKQFHSRQIELALIRREQHEKVLAAEAAVNQGQQLRNNLEDARQVQQDLYKSLNNAEKVVEVLQQKTVAGTHKEADSSEFLSQLFEDLKLMNQKSMLLVQALVQQLDDRIAENEELREAAHSKDGDASKGPQSRTSSLEKKNRESVDIDQDLHSNLEELPPLELPSFDFNTFSTMSATTTKDETDGPESTLEGDGTTGKGH